MPNNDYTIDGIEWRDIPDYEGLYQVSDIGMVRCLVARGRYSAGFRRQYISVYGYPFVILYKAGVAWTITVHKLVMLAFVGEANGLDVNHIDGDKTNNTLGNLEYVTRSQNIRHARDVLGYPDPFGDSRVGENNGKAVINEDTVRQIRRMFSDGMRVYEIAKSLSLSWDIVSRVAKRKNWKHID